MLPVCMSLSSNKKSVLLCTAPKNAQSNNEEIPYREPRDKRMKIQLSALHFGERFRSLKVIRDAHCVARSSAVVSPRSSTDRGTGNCQMHFPAAGCTYLCLCVYFGAPNAAQNMAGDQLPPPRCGREGAAGAPKHVKKCMRRRKKRKGNATLHDRSEPPRASSLPAERRSRTAFSNP